MKNLLSLSLNVQLDLLEGVRISKKEVDELAKYDILECSFLGPRRMT